jgi:chromosome segregation ATPase
MPKQSRVKKPNEFELEVRQRLATLEIQHSQLKKDLDATQRAIHIVEENRERLKKDVASDFQDQDDEIEKISRRLQSVEDKLKAKQLGEETNVTLTARVKDLQRQLTDAKNRIEQMETQALQMGHLIDIERNEWQRSVENVRKERDAETERADRVQRELNEAGITITELQFKLAAAERKPKPLFWRWQR